MVIMKREKQAEQIQQNKSLKQKKRTKKIVIIVLAVVFALVLIGFAWYYFQLHRSANSEKREVMSPYYLYLVDQNGTDSLNLTIGNLHPGETKQIVFGVTNKAPDGESEVAYPISKDSNFHYEMELAYTQNLPLNYQVYELQKTESGTFQKTLLTQKAGSEEISNKKNEEMYGENAEDIVNYGKYQIYDKDGGGTALSLTTKINQGNVDFDLDYFMVELTWQEGIQFSDYLKETDLVYIIVNAMQLEPEESTQ